MSITSRFYRRVEEALPSFYKNHIRQSMIFAGIEMNYKEWTGFFFLYSLATGLTALIVIFLFTQLEWYYLTAAVLGIFLIFQLISELLLSLTKRGRTLFIEKILPDVLSLLASNVKSGMTIDQALLLANRDEFGKFKSDLVNASKETLAGKNLGEALVEISNGIDSKLFRKTVNLIVEGINGGGELSSLLENIAQDIRDMDVLRKEIRASVLMYTLILFIASGFGAPLLFGVSLYEVQTLSELTALVPDVDVPTSVTFLNFQPGAVNIEFLRTIIVIGLIINAVFGALMYGVLETGSAKDGVKMIPLLLVLSVAVFFLSNYFIGTLFTGVTSI
ncbi:MAG: type II secretion system F family protein [Nanoarchaeota archaeon]|nr:type II secretion system F family protein [Nanoarchaeota archaeon]